MFNKNLNETKKIQNDMMKRHNVRETTSILTQRRQIMNRKAVRIDEGELFNESFPKPMQSMFRNDLVFKQQEVIKRQVLDLATEDSSTPKTLVNQEPKIRVVSLQQDVAPVLDFAGANAERDSETKKVREEEKVKKAKVLEKEESDKMAKKNEEAKKKKEDEEAEEKKRVYDEKRRKKDMQINELRKKQKSMESSEFKNIDIYAFSKKTLTDMYSFKEDSKS